jgi:D-glycero-alpha-D-manno-heptose-7-phosphate kinase
MIISQTPLRICFGGDRTDLKDYSENYGGAVLSTTIDKYVYVILRKRIDDLIWLRYSENESSTKLEEVKNTRWKECMKTTGVTKGVELINLSYIPKGSGLGGSSAFTIGSLNSLYALIERYKSAKELAEEACKIEIDTLKESESRQDQYSAAYGGLNLIEFQKDGNVQVNPVIMPNKTRESLFSNLLLFKIKDADLISFIPKQKERTEQKTEVLHKLKELAYLSRDALQSSDLRRFGELLHQNWEYKKKLAENISNQIIDKYYNLGREAGAIGGKVCGGEAGGFLLFYVEPEKHDKVRNALRELKECPIKFEPFGSKIVYVGEKQ